ncbi:TonB-dependent receptor [Pedobacter sp. P351]|uniref:SusC/RagA family TonB-linked outer membrane protein n=1 Tax=Pedobacter superstes TaxID=3133441 RepID=UPI0030A75E0C
MKLTFALIFILSFQVLATGYSQNKVTLSLKSADFKKVISEIEKRTAYRFVFSERRIPLSRDIDIDVANQDALSVIGQVLQGTAYTYQILQNDLIAIVPKGVVISDLTVNGKVLDETNQPLIGATVKIKGVAAGGTTTDVSGAFSITAPENAVLTIAYVGYETQEVPVNGRAVLSVKMSPSARNLNEVVVVGYGTQRKADVTGSIVSVSSTTITRSATPDATGALQGQAPGVTVVKNVGKPGSGYSINIRGLSSFGGSNSPLFVIDGVPTSSGLNDLNPADIEKIDILKDASATAIYGSRGAKGVVIVTTKRGKSGKTAISYDAYMGVRKPTNLPEFFTGPEFVAYRKEVLKGQGSNAAPFSAAMQKNIDEGKFTEWPSLVLENGLQMNHNITASGGDDKTRFSLSAGFLEEEGNVAPESFQRYSLRGNIDRQISEKWKTGLNLYFAQNLRDLGSSEALRSSYRMPPMAYPYDASGNPVFAVYDASSVTNPLFDQENDLRQNRNLRSFGSLYVQVAPFKDLTLKSTIYPSYSAGRSGTFFSSMSKQGIGSLPSEGTTSYREQFSWILDNQASYEKQLGLHKVNATLVQSLQKDREETSNVGARGLGYRSLWYNLAPPAQAIGYGSSFTQSTLASFSTRVNYNYNDRYLITATGRWDGSSRLAAGNQWAFFPSASFAWRLSQEKFIQNISAINDLKLRLSYGITGNDGIGAYSSQSSLGATFYDFGGVNTAGYAPNRLPNKQLTWESTGELNLGLDFVLLNNRISGSVDAYNRRVNNAIQNRALPPFVGFSTIADNIGKLRNRGIEVGLSTINIRKGAFSWKTDFVFDANKNEVLETAIGKKDDVANLWFIGQPVQVNYDYVFDGIWQLAEKDQAAKYNQKPGQVRVKDLSGPNGAPDGKIDATYDRQIIGKRIPDWTGSFSNTFRYGDLDLFVMIYTRQGEQFRSNFDQTFMGYSGDLNQIKVDYWTENNPSQTIFQPGNGGNFSSVLTWRNTNFTRVGNITLGYNLPANLLKKVKVGSLRVYGTVTNPFTFTDDPGFDPEWASQNTFGTAVGSSSYLFGLNLSF